MQSFYLICYDLLENIIERLERIEKKIDSYEFTE